MWRRIGGYITTWLDESSPPYLNHVITLASPRTNWISESHTQKAAARWAAAVLETPYSDAVGQIVVDVLLRIAYNDSLRTQIPIEIWGWLKIRPYLPPVCWGRYWGSAISVFHHIQGIGDIEILKSYLLLVWSEWEYNPSVWAEGSIEEDFGGIGMWCHREDLIERLDHILVQLDRGLEYFKQHEPAFNEGSIEGRKELYGRLKEKLLEMDMKAMRTLSRTPPIILLDENSDVIDVSRIPLDSHLCPSSFLPVISCRKSRVASRHSYTVIRNFGIPRYNLAHFSILVSPFSNCSTIRHGPREDDCCVHLLLLRHHPYLRECVNRCTEDSWTPLRVKKVQPHRMIRVCLHHGSSVGLTLSRRGESQVLWELNVEFDCLITVVQSEGSGGGVQRTCGNVALRRPS